MSTVLQGPGSGFDARTMSRLVIVVVVGVSAHEQVVAIESWSGLVISDAQLGLTLWSR